MAKDFPEWTLEFAGNADEEKIIKEIAKDEGILNQVKFLGSVIDVTKIKDVLLDLFIGRLYEWRRF